MWPNGNLDEILPCSCTSRALLGELLRVLRVLRVLFGILALDASLEVVDLTLQQVQSFVQHVDLAAGGQIEAVQEVGDLSNRATNRLDELAVLPVLFDLLLNACERV